MSSARLQTRALISKNWNFQKRNVGSNICLCSAPIFFCVILAIMQGLINNLLLSGDDFKCGCRCTQCCPKWAMASVANNYSSDGNGTVTIKPEHLSIFGSISGFDPSQVTTLADGSVVIQTCGPVNSGACPTDYGYTCLSKNNSECGIQFSSTRQSQYCSVKHPSAWPPVSQIPDIDRRAKPWGVLNETAPNGTTITVPGVPFLITADSPSVAQSLAPRVFDGQLTGSFSAWVDAVTKLYTGNATYGNVFNGDELSKLGFQFGTNADLQINLYIERAFQPGEELYVIVPASECVAKNISVSSTPICVQDFLKAYLRGTPAGNALNEILPGNCNLTSLFDVSSGNTTTVPLLSASSLRVICTETFPVQEADPEDLEDRLYCGYYQARCNVSDPINRDYATSFDFGASGPERLDLTVYWNDTIGDNAGGAPDRTKRLPASLSAAVTAWWGLISGSSAAPTAPMELLGVMSMPKFDSELSLDFSSLLGPLFYSWVVQLLLPTFLQQLVYEKEKRLRTMMKMHGLGDISYWIVTYLWFLLLYVIYIAIFIIFGAAINLKSFRFTNIGIQIIFYFLFGNCMIGLAFLASSFFSSTRTAVVVAFLYVFATGLLGELLLKFFMDGSYDWIFFAEWVPAFALYRGLYEMSEYTFLAVYTNQKRGMTFDNLKDANNGMRATWGIFVVEWAIFMLLGWYLEQVLPNGNSVRRRPLFFIEWIWRKPGDGHLNQHHTTSAEADRATPQLTLQAKSETKVAVRPAGEQDDVEAERRRVNNLQDTSGTPILISDLRKVYPGIDGGKAKVAVQSLTLGVNRGECFGLLGPNGAGKTTAISMLTGFLEPSGGEANVEGLNIKYDMQQVYKLMGVCPQHDLLWEQLSGREHLRFYGMLKGLTGAELEAAVEAALRSVNLWSGGVGDKLSGKYSGGMKRRLSVAISFIGSPKVVYLDEPSTGLDPASRRNLWDVVRSGKSDRAIILTTHSMQEAEALCDRLGIFVDGRLVCIGPPREITSRYAGFLVFSLTVAPECEADARDFVMRMAPGAQCTYSLAGTFKFELPSSEVSLSGVFEAVAAAKERLQIIDWAVANATLEEVFIKLASNLGLTSSGN